MGWDTMLAVRRYFYSGWAFFIPYLALYLLYFTVDGPINAAAGAVPSLLQLYWLVHAIHLILAANALVSWIKLQRPVSTWRRDLKQLFPAIKPIVPWVLLALVFYIPGVYLEWPSDPCEHLRRINEWRGITTIDTHSTWTKSGYFIPYSLLHSFSGFEQLFWLKYYYTAICLLLCWHYYRLARACRLSEQASMLFVIAQTLLFGNNVFSFYRYYGISTSIYAQLGAVALTALALNAATLPNKGPRIAKGTLLSHIRSAISRRLSLIVSSGLLVLFIGFNHPQGLAIAAFGIGAVVGWRLTEWMKTGCWWMLAVVISISAVYLAICPPTEIHFAYQRQGFLAPWWGFSLLDPATAGGDAVLKVLGLGGVINILIALLLVRRNHPAAWFALFPLIALSLPFISVPFSTALSKHGDPIEIIVFQRMLFASPTMLAGVAALSEFHQRARKETTGRGTILGASLAKFRQFSTEAATGGLIATALFGIVTPSGGRPFYNRFWQDLAIIPDCLSLRGILSATGNLDDLSGRVVSPAIGSALLSFETLQLIGPLQFRAISQPTTTAATSAYSFLGGTTLDTSLPVNVPLRERTDPMRGTNLDQAEGWTSLGGVSPRFVRNDNAGKNGYALRNPIGQISNPFTASLMPIDPRKTYRLKISARTIGGNAAVVYLGVAWYDKDGHPLYSNEQGPSGAGQPMGWVNGTFSYFGLVNQTPPSLKAAYLQIFGRFTTAAIPARARFVRIGALLNHHGTPDAEVEISDLFFNEVEPKPFKVVAPPYNFQTVAYSIAGALSMHWPANQLAIDLCGSAEIARAIAGIRRDKATKLGNLAPDR